MTIEKMQDDPHEKEVRELQKKYKNILEKLGYGFGVLISEGIGCSVTLYELDEYRILNTRGDPVEGKGVSLEFAIQDAIRKIEDRKKERKK